MKKKYKSVQKKKEYGTIRLHNAVFYAYHGVLEDEQNLGGKFAVDVDLECDLTRGAKSDRLEDTVNYERVYDCIRALVMDKRHFLVESLTSSIGEEILKKFLKVRSVAVRVRKPGAPVKGVIDYVEVELTKTRK